MIRTSRNSNSQKNPNKRTDSSSLGEKKQKRAAAANFLNTFTSSNGGSFGTTFNGYGIQALPSNGETIVLINQPFITSTNPILVSTMIAKLNSAGAMSSLFSIQGNAPLKSNVSPLGECKSSDNGVMISGVATDASGANPNIIIIKLDSAMAVKWATSVPLIAGDTRKMAYFAGTTGAPSTIACTSDGGVIFSAFSKNTVPDIILSKLNSNGQAQWSYNITATGALPYSPGRSISYLPYPVPFYISADGSIVMTYTPNTQFNYIGNSTLLDTETMIVTAKLNLASQTTVWATAWGAPSLSDAFAMNLVTAISPTKDGGTAISAYSLNAFSAIANSNPENSVILKLNAQGTGVFTSLFGGNATSDGCRPFSLTEDADASLIAVGSTSGKINTYHFQTHITKLTDNGAFKWQSTLSSPSCTLFSAANAYVDSSDNTVTLSGSISSGCLGSGSGSLFVAKTPTDGSTFGCSQLQSTKPALFTSVGSATTPIQVSIQSFNLITTDRTKNIVSTSLTPTQRSQCSTVKTSPPTPASQTSSSGRLVPFFSLSSLSPGLNPIHRLSRSNGNDMQGEFVERPSAYQSSPSVDIVGQLMLAGVLLYLARIAYSFIMGTSSNRPSSPNRSSLFYSSAASNGMSAHTVTQLSTAKRTDVTIRRQCSG